MRCVAVLQLGSVFALNPNTDVATLLAGIRDAKTLAKHRDTVSKLADRMIRSVAG